MILSAISSSPELLSIDKNNAAPVSETKNTLPSDQTSGQILTSTSETPEQALIDQVEISYEAKRQAELAQYAEYEMYAQSQLAAEEINTQMLSQKEQEQSQAQVVVAFPGVNLLI